MLPGPLDDIGSVTRRKAHSRYVDVKRRLREDRRKYERWQELEDRYRGERAFLIGNGPSLNRTPLHLLKGEHTLAFNRFNLMFERLAWRPTMYMSVDERVARDKADEIASIIDGMEYAFFPDIHPSGEDFREFVPDRGNVYWLRLEWDGFYRDLPRAGLGGTVANVGLQVLTYMGFSPIYLCGVDMDYGERESVEKENERDWVATDDDDPNHFDPRYFGEGDEYHYPRVEENMLPSMRRAHQETEDTRTEIRNAGIGGKLEAFPRVDFRELFDVDHREEMDLFLEGIDREISGSTLEEAFPGADHIERPAQFDEDASVVIAPVDVAVKLIDTAVETHVPHGPMDERFVFVHRLGSA
jgi:hypothetical protein